jgi:hypothetical protein
MLLEEAHICIVCKLHTALWDPTGLATHGRGCLKNHENGFPKFVESCPDYDEREEEIERKILIKGW